MDAHMTTATKRDEIRFDIVERISVYVMNICSIFFMANFTNVRSFFREFFKPTMTMLKMWRMVISIKLSNTFFRAKLTFFIFFNRFAYNKFLIAIFTRTFNISSLCFKSTIPRAIMFFSIFKPRFSKFKTLFTISAFQFNKDTYSKSFIRTFSGAKTFFLSKSSIFLNIKMFITNSTNQFHSFISKFMLANGRAKKIFMPFKFIGKCFKRFMTIRALRKHELDFSTRMIYRKEQTTGANV